MKWFESTQSCRTKGKAISKNRRLLLKLNERRSSKDLRKKKSKEELSRSTLKTCETSFNRKNTRKCCERRKEEKRPNECKTRQTFSELRLTRNK